MTSDFLYDYIETVNFSYNKLIKKLRKQYPNVPEEVPSIAYIITMLNLASLRSKCDDKEIFLKAVFLMAEEASRGFAEKRYIRETEQ